MAEPKHSKKNKTLAIPIQLALAGVVILTGCGFLGQFHRLLDMACHFRVQYAAVSFLCFFVLVMIRRRRWALAALVCCLVNASLVLPWYFNAEQVTNPSGNPLRIYYANVYTDNQQHHRLLAAVKASNPDLVALLEVNDAWTESLKPLQHVYPYQVALPQDDNFGMALFSRIPLNFKQIEYIGNTVIPTLQVELQGNEKPVSLLLTHPLPPVTETGFNMRNQQLAAVSKHLASLKDPKILIGDLNLTMWSSFYADFIRESGMQNARQGFGVIPTWPSWNPILRIPLDHCLVSPDIDVIQCKSDPDIGSDHLPLLVKLILP
ncbi:MAG: endonuclease/exonuclease/phosphatase family protein [Planctomycetes bacterium]|nr:endonuclease/exonuclease/phosphatase family protein [Planctomycetota bacterium]